MADRDLQVARPSHPGHQYQQIEIRYGAKAQLGDFYRISELLSERAAPTER